MLQYKTHIKLKTVSLIKFRFVACFPETLLKLHWQQIPEITALDFFKIPISIALKWEAGGYQKEWLTDLKDHNGSQTV